MILVTGATGKVGSEVCRQLAARKVPVRAYVRNSEKAAAMLPAGVELFGGDLLLRPQLEAALAGVEKMFLVTPVNQKMFDVEKFLIDVAKEAGVKHVAVGTGTIYRELLKQVVAFFKDKKSPVDVKETVEIMAFIEAALKSAGNHGAGEKVSA